LQRGRCRDTWRVGEPRIELRRAAQRFVTAADGIVSRHSFSYGRHYDPGNVAHGPLLVNNEELLAAYAGFGDHPHADAEIVTWVIAGSLVHEDSRGHSGVIYPGLAQRMSAGSGIVHTERNDAYRIDPDRPPEPAHFVQMWLRPDEPGLPPSYEQRPVDPADLDRGWVPVASGHDPDAAVHVGCATATLWVTRLDPGAVRILPEAGHVHAFLAAGRANVEGVGELASGDALRITGPAGLRVTGEVAAELLVWTMEP
jgi:redox-sensitive bicupin YhaK (pirin superfamily)